MASLSSSEKQVIEDFIDYGTDKFGFNTGKALPLTLVFLGERDGCLLGGKDSADDDFLQDLFEDNSIPHKIVSGDQFFVAKSQSHLQKYDPAGSAEEVGRFLGYPDEAIQFYLENSDRVDLFVDFLQSEASISESEWEDRSFLIEYVPTPTDEGIQRALDRQEQYEAALRSASVDLSEAHNYSF